jgi:hypothetical protein
LVFKALAMIERGEEVRKDLLPNGFVDYGSELTAEIAPGVIDLSEKINPFLGQIQTFEMGSLSEEVPMMSIDGFSSLRVDEGGEIDDADMKTPTKLTRRLEAHDIDTPYSIPINTVLNYRTRVPQLESMIGNGMEGRHTNDKVEVGFQGTTDTYNPASPKTTLAKGWTTIAREGATGGEAWRLIDNSVLTFTEILDTMDEAIDRMAANYEDILPDCVFVMGTSDFNKFQNEMLDNIGAYNDLVNGAAAKYKGYLIYVVKGIVAGNGFFTPIKNFVIGVVTQGTNGMRVQAKDRWKVRDYLRTSAVDYDLVSPKRCITWQQ